MLWKHAKQTGAQSTEIPKVILEGERIILRHPEAGDYEQWKTVRGRNRLFLKSYEPTWPENCLSADFFARRLRRQQSDWQQDRARHFLIFEKSSGQLLGGININDIKRGVSQNASLGYWLDEDIQGQGLMAEAMILILHYAFTNLNLHRIHAACIPDNERSKKLLIRAGFQEEGFAKSYLKIDGRWQDHILFGFCKQDWIDIPS